jgi:hypothetical protein
MGLKSFRLSDFFEVYDRETFHLTLACLRGLISLLSKYDMFRKLLGWNKIKLARKQSSLRNLIVAINMQKLVVYVLHLTLRPQITSQKKYCGEICIKTYILLLKYLTFQ